MSLRTFEDRCPVVTEVCECGVKERSGADIETGDIAHSWEPNLWMWMCSTRETVQSKREDTTECNGQIGVRRGNVCGDGEGEVGLQGES